MRSIGRDSHRCPLRCREASFGHAILQLVNATTATFTWHRNQDGAPVVGDFATIVRDTVACPCASILNPHSLPILHQQMIVPCIRGALCRAATNAYVVARWPDPSRPDAGTAPFLV